MKPSLLLNRYARFAVTHPWRILICVLAVTVLASLGLVRVYIELDPDQQLPQHHPYIRALNEAHRLFGDKNLLIIGLRPFDRDPFDPAFLMKTKQITDRLSRLPGVVLPLLQSIASPTLKHIHSDVDGIHIQRLMPEVPGSTSEANDLRVRLHSDPSLLGTIVATNDSALGIYATFELTDELPGYVNLHFEVLKILNEERDDTFEFFLSGPVVIASSLSIRANDMAYLLPIALIVIGLVHYDAFRTLQAVVFPLATGILAVIWAVGFMGYLGVPIDPYNSTTPILILAVSAGHAVQILKRYYEELGHLEDNHAAIVASIENVGGVMIAAGSIAVLSFLSLATLGTDSLRTFGLFTGLGILSAVVIELTIIPAARALLPRPSEQHLARQAAVHPSLDRVLRYSAMLLTSPSAARRVLIAYAGLIVVSLLLATRLEVDTSLKRVFAEGDPVRTQDDLLNQLFAGTNVLLFVVEGPYEGSLAEPDALRAIDALERQLETLPGVGKAISVVDTIKVIHRTFAGDDADLLPNSKALISQYLLLYTLSPDNDLATRLTPDNRKAKVVVLLKEDSTRFGQRTIAAAKEIAASLLPSGFALHVSGTLASNAALTEVIVTGKILNVIQIAFITVLIAGLLLRSWFSGLLVAVPLAVAVLINLALMSALDLPLDISTAVVSALAVGIGADYAVYFLFRVRAEYAIDHVLEAAVLRAMLTSGKAILFVSSAIALGYAVLCLSGFRIFVQLGAFVGLAMLTSSLATLLVLPAILTSISRTSWIGSVLGYDRTERRPPDSSSRSVARA